jgi:triacylglycerol lipase
MRKISVLLAALLAAIVTALIVPAARADTAQRHPILFVHGLSSFAANWDPMISYLVGQGYDRSQLEAFSYDWRQSNTITAQQISTEVDGLLQRTGAQKVDIVAHSMGGLSARWYLKFLGGTAKVDHFVSIGSPHHGAALAAVCTIFFTSCEEMRPNSAFLNQLNAGDETPGDVSYTALWSTCDEAVSTQASAQLAGANNVNIGCIEHAYQLFSDTVDRDTLTALG